MKTENVRQIAKKTGAVNKLTTGWMRLIKSFIDMVLF